jgi:hypothetical protein
VCSARFARSLKSPGAVVCISSAALRAQSADNDAGIALCLQRCAGGEIDRPIERIDALLEGGAT